MSESTPRTDIHAWYHDASSEPNRARRDLTGYHVRADFARTLERELNMVRWELEQLKEEMAADAATSQSEEMDEMAATLQRSMGMLLERTEQRDQLRTTNAGLLEALWELRKGTYHGGADRAIVDAAIAGATEKPAQPEL